ncbi:MAG TPA: hypothetical protein PKI03_25465 [Pseudomonadota bacterium]|nr:hypothetical protein [Pseudomonadota bacterium]
MRSSWSLRLPRLAALVPALLALWVVLSPGDALACPVCFVAREASRLAFMWTAILMTFLPLAMIGGIVYWIWRSARRAADESLPQEPR